MARPKKEGMEYFPHDTAASGDDKIEAMRAAYGNDGYTFYFILCERIYRTPAAELDASSKLFDKTMGKVLMVTPERFMEMLESSFEEKLFDREAYETRRVLTSNGIKKRHNEVFKRLSRDRQRKQSADSPPLEEPQEQEPPIHTDEGSAQQEVAATSDNVVSFPTENPRKNDGIKVENTTKTGEKEREKEREKEIKDSLSVNAREEKSRALNLPDPNAPVTTKEINLLRHEGGKPNVLGGLLRYNVGIVGGMYHIERIESYMDMMDDALILDAIRRSSGKDDAYVVGILKKWNALKYRKLEDHPDYKEGETGGGLSNGGRSAEQPQGRSRAPRTVDEVKSTSGRQVWPKRE